MNVLLIQLKRIGDLILTVPAIAAVRHAYPAARITLVVAHGSRELLPAIPGIDRGLVARGNAADVGQWLALLCARFDYCLDFSRTDRSAFLSWISGARERFTYDSVRREPIRQLCYSGFIPSRVREVHTIDHHLALLAPLGVHEALPEIHLVLPESAKRKAAEIIATHGLEEGFVILHPGSARAEKFWVSRRWAELADTLSAKTRVVITGSESTMERIHIAELKSFLRQPAVDLLGQLDLLTLCALLERARLLVTIDSAPMHLAAALGTPQVALFGPTNPFHWRPRSTPAVILQGNVGTHRDFQPRHSPALMNEISTKQVIDAMQSLLSHPAAPEP
ncbi:MAG TPA: glycosyltransferase family 9 protein [Chthoniobacterales bacterium]|nr:glycosyltransferase family 9 protein [Chthoniobacterales bacterium]